MNFISKLFSRARRSPGRSIRPGSRRGYSAGDVNRLTHSWTTTSKTMDAYLEAKLNILRARSRDMAERDDYAKRFLALVKANVIGKGIKFQSTVKNDDGKAFDKGAIERIETGFEAWGKRGACTVCGKHSWADVQRICMESIARDGEVLVRLVKAWPGNDFGFALQLLEGDHLDINLNRPKVPGKANTIRLGVEYDTWDRPVAYHLTKRHPAESAHTSYQTGGHQVIPAAEMVHPFITQRIRQSRGIPWLATPLFRLNMLSGYEDAELVASRVAAAKMGFITSPEGDGYTGDHKDDDGHPIINAAEAGIIEQLPEGTKFEPWDPTHPVAAFKDFVKGILRGVSSGLNVSYNALANDLEGVTYSSLRQGKLDERDQWTVLQWWIEDNLHDVVFSTWLNMALTTQAVALPYSKLEKFRAHKWQARGWQWVDPLKEATAYIKSIQAGLTSLSDVAAERGESRDDILDRLAADKKAAADRGLTLTIFQEPPEKGKPSEKQKK